MSWTVTSTPTDGGGHETVHGLREPDRHRPSHTLSVAHYPEPSRDTTHFVSMMDPTRNDRSLWWPTGKHGADRAYLGHGEYGPPPSEELRTLIETHGAHPDQWMPLLDKLAEEYPDHFNEAVSRHTAARAQS